MFSSRCDIRFKDSFDHFKNALRYYAVLCDKVKSTTTLTLALAHLTWCQLFGVGEGKQAANKWNNLKFINSRNHWAMESSSFTSWVDAAKERQQTTKISSGKKRHLVFLNIH